LDHSDKFTRALPQNPEEVHDLAVQVVQDLEGGRRLLKQHACPASERLNVALMRRKVRDDPGGNPKFPAVVADRRPGNSVVDGAVAPARSGLLPVNR